MIIESVELKNFRNYDHLNIEFDQGTNIFFGDNAQGKTNILESIYVSGTTKSHKGSKDREMIQFEHSESHIRTIINKNHMKYQVDIHLKKNKSKGIAINGIPIKRAGELFGILNIVLFSPEDLNLIKNGPGDRRRFIDMELCQLDKVYMNDLGNYNKVLNQRNKLLKDINYSPALRDTLAVWNQQLCLYGEKVINSRKKFIEHLNEIVYGIHKNLSGEKEELILKYEPNVEEDTFEKGIIESLERDLKFKTTSVGPHRDDLSFLVNGIDIRRFGSQGQQRTSALSVKLAEIELVKQTINDMPVLLLDDVLSELDSNRQNYLLKRISNIQTLITCTGLDEFVKNRFEINRLYHVINGEVFNGVENN